MIREAGAPFQDPPGEPPRAELDAPSAPDDSAPKSEPHLRIAAMKPRISLITLAVDDLQRAVAFYRDGLGLPTEGIVGEDLENGAVAFFDLQTGLKLALWPRLSLAADSGLTAGPSSPTELSLGHNVSSRAEVDAVMAQAGRAGATIVKAAADTFWGGYAGYFQDPDGHLWEVAWNPQWTLPGDD